MVDGLSCQVKVLVLSPLGGVWPALLEGKEPTLLEGRELELEHG